MYTYIYMNTHTYISIYIYIYIYTHTRICIYNREGGGPRGRHQAAISRRLQSPVHRGAPRSWAWAPATSLLA